MTKLKELEKRLRDEPENLGLRVMLAGALHEAGRLADAVELYRSVAIVYREQGRLAQASTVCRSILEIAPGDASSQALLAMMTASEVPPVPVLYHPAGATTSSSPLSRAQLPPSLQRELDGIPELSGIASAARQISESLIAASRQRDEAAERAAFDDDGAIDRETRKLTRATVTELYKRAARSQSGSDGDDEPTLLPAGRGGRISAGDDELTLPPGIRGQHARTGADDDDDEAEADNDETAPHELPAFLSHGRRNAPNDD